MAMQGLSRFLRFRLRTLFVLTACASIFAGWWALKHRKTYPIRDVAAAELHVESSRWGKTVEIQKFVGTKDGPFRCVATAVSSEDVRTGINQVGVGYRIQGKEDTYRATPSLDTILIYVFENPAGDDLLIVARLVDGN